MADVRLTATNPEDSSVVPVACNEKGELKLEEPQVVEGPKGDDGEKGDKGDKGDPGDPFSGNFTGNVYFDGNVGIKRANTDVDLEVGASSTRSFYVRQGSEGSNYIEIGARTSLDNPGYLVVSSYEIQFDTVNKESALIVSPSGRVGIGKDRPSTALDVAGKAGFTEEGHLWCTTPRGDTVMLTATVGGAGMWEEYTPPTVREDTDWSEKNVIRPMPEESSQDEPETPQ